MSLYTALTCTPHFKYDTKDPYITKEGDSHIHCWFNPDKTQTLSQLAACIEAQLLDEHQEAMKQNSCACCYGPGEFTVTSMEVGGSTHDCQAMATKITLECLSNEESFNVTVRSSVAGCVIL